MAAYKSYKHSEDFWYKYSEPTGRDGNGPRKRFCWTKILKMLRLTKQEVDMCDMERAKALYLNSQEFIKHFSYRKGSKTMVFKKVAHIARQLRKIEGDFRYWDYPDEEEDEEMENGNSE